jgi:hypothetical protein
VRALQLTRIRPDRQPDRRRMQQRVMDQAVMHGLFHPRALFLREVNRHRHRNLEIIRPPRAGLGIGEEGLAAGKDSVAPNFYQSHQSVSVTCVRIPSVQGRPTAPAGPRMWIVWSHSSASAGQCEIGRSVGRRPKPWPPSVKR